MAGDGLQAHCLSIEDDLSHCRGRRRIRRRCREATGPSRRVAQTRQGRRRDTQCPAHPARAAGGAALLGPTCIGARGARKPPARRSFTTRPASTAKTCIRLSSHDAPAPHARSWTPELGTYRPSRAHLRDRGFPTRARLGSHRAGIVDPTRSVPPACAASSSRCSMRGAVSNHFQSGTSTTSAGQQVSPRDPAEARQRAGRPVLPRRVVGRVGHRGGGARRRAPRRREVERRPVALERDRHRRTTTARLLVVLDPPREECRA